MSRSARRRHDTGVGHHVPGAERSPTTGDHRVPLATLYARFDAIARGRDTDRDSWAAHVAILDRLAANRRDAERAGWTSLALERDGGRDGGHGRLRLFGFAPDTMRRSEVPDAVSLADHAG